MIWMTPGSTNSVSSVETRMPRDDDGRERPLHLGAGAGRDRHREEAERRDRAGREHGAHRVRRAVDDRLVERRAVLEAALHVGRP